jgi:NTE family protein
VKKTYGYYKTDRLIEDLGKVMAAKGFSPDLTFEELNIAHQSGKNVKLLYLTGANLTDQKTEVFSHETYPTMRVLDAVRISISIPMYFEAVFMQPDGSLVEKKDADSTTKVMVDGGVLDNYPFFVFDTLVTVNSGDNSYYKCNIHSLGIKLETDSSTLDIATRTIGKTGDFMGAFSGISSEYLNRRHLGPQQKKQTIFINTHNFNPKLKRQKEATKMRVMQYGRKAVFEYFISR